MADSVSDEVITLALETLALAAPADSSAEATMRPLIAETARPSPLAASIAIPTGGPHAQPPSFLPRLSMMPPGASEPGCDLEVRGLLGEGGMGRVLHGYQRSLRRDVALKTLRDDVDPRFSELLVTEGFLTGHLEHPNIVPVHLLGIDPKSQLPLLVMKRVSGVPWTDLLEDAKHPLWARFSEGPLETHLRILMQIADALAFAHGKGVLHRDVKPENVMLGELGEVYLVDWGVAIQIEGPWATTGSAKASYVGTPCCMAPELLDASLPEGPWTDVYLLGATLHWILLGKPRHPGATLREALASAAVSAPFPYPKSVPVELADLCRRSMAREPKDRIQDAPSFRRDVADFLAHEGSNLLADAAEEKAREALALEASTDGEEARAKVARLRTESRFGFLLAQREWGESGRAKRGLRDLLLGIANAELAREDVQSARIAIDELRELSPADGSALAPALAALEARIQARQADILRLRAAEAAADMRTGARSRSSIFATFAAMTAVLTVVLAVTRGSSGQVVHPGMLVVTGAVFVAVSGTGLVIAKRHHGVNEGSRALLAAFFGAIVASFVNRVLAYTVGTDPSDVLRVDLLIGSGCAIVTAVLSRMRGFFGHAALFAGAAVVVTRSPSSAFWVFPAAVFSVFATASFSAWQMRVRTPKVPKP